MTRRGFTIIELLVVIAIIAILAAILFPVFARAREKARSAQCISNLKQLGNALQMYMDDYDGLYPWAVDAPDHLLPQIWNDYPNWQAWIPYMPLLRQVLDPYAKSREVWHCASDRGFDELEGAGVALAAHPTAFAALGSSYVYRTELSFRLARQESLPDPVALNVLFDANGSWHGGGGDAGEQRWNILYADGHVKSANLSQFDQAWATPAY